MTQNKFECSHRVVSRGRKCLGLRTATVVMMLSFLLSSCQPVAAGIAGTGFEIYIAVTSIMTFGFGIRLKNFRFNLHNQ